MLLKAGAEKIKQLTKQIQALDKQLAKATTVEERKRIREDKRQLKITIQATKEYYTE
jgi:Tfp pilus assembly protein PilN